MNDMQKVDVLALLDALATQTKQRGGSPSVENIETARAAVADLIDMATRGAELIEAQSKIIEQYRQSGDCPKDHATEAVDLLHEANHLVNTGSYNSKHHGAKLRAALARVGGDA